MRYTTHISRAYRAWCKQTFPDYRVADFPLRGRMFEIWTAAWLAAAQHHQGESK